MAEAAPGYEQAAMSLLGMRSAPPEQNGHAQQIVYQYPAQPVLVRPADFQRAGGLQRFATVQPQEHPSSSPAVKGTVGNVLASKGHNLGGMVYVQGGRPNFSVFYHPPYPTVMNPPVMPFQVMCPHPHQHQHPTMVISPGMYHHPSAAGAYAVQPGQFQFASPTLAAQPQLAGMESQPHRHLPKMAANLFQAPQKRRASNDSALSKSSVKAGDRVATHDPKVARAGGTRRGRPPKLSKHPTLPDAEGTDNDQDLNGCPFNLPQTYRSTYNCDGRIGIYAPSERKLLISKFMAKRKLRNWNKNVAYVCRKNLANRRVRVKGRFIRRSPDEQPLCAKQIAYEEECARRARENVEKADRSERGRVIAAR